MALSASRLLLILRLLSSVVVVVVVVLVAVVIGVASFPSILDRRGGSGSEDLRLFRLLRTPEGGSWVHVAATVGEIAAIAVRPRSEKDMFEW